MIFLVTWTHDSTKDGGLDGTDGAYLLMATQTADEVLKVLESDLFYLQGTICEQTGQGWHPVIGPR